MTTPLKLTDEQVAEFLRRRAGDPPPVLLAEFVNRARTEPQVRRSPFDRWMAPTTNRMVGYGLGAAVVVFLAVIGIQLLLGMNVGGPGPSPVPSGSPSAAATPFVSSDAGTVCLVDTGDGAYQEEPCPPIVIPPRQSDSGTVTVEIPNADPVGIEGGYYYMQVATEDNQLVLNQRLEYRVPEDQGPAESGEIRPPPSATGVAYLTPGSYVLNVYLRTCSGFCGFLMPPRSTCAYAITVEPYQPLTVEYRRDDCLAGAPRETQVNCVGFSGPECDRRWREFLANMGVSPVDSLGRNRVVVVTVTAGACDAAIDVRFSDGTGVATAGGLC